jgi:hypothetical protein
MIYVRTACGSGGLPYLIGTRKLGLLRKMERRDIELMYLVREDTVATTKADPLLLMGPSHLSRRINL